MHYIITVDATTVTFYHHYCYKGKRRDIKNTKEKFVLKCILCLENFILKIFLQKFYFEKLILKILSRKFQKNLSFLNIYSRSHFYDKIAILKISVACSKQSWGAASKSLAENEPNTGVSNKAQEAVSLLLKNQTLAISQFLLQIL